METDAVELLARSGDVKAWREGTDLHITVPAEASEEDFKRVMTVMGLDGLTDYDYTYIPETGDEIIYITERNLPRQGGLDVQPRLASVGALGVALGTLPGVLNMLASGLHLLI